MNIQDLFVSLEASLKSPASAILDEKSDDLFSAIFGNDFKTAIANSVAADEKREKNAEKVSRHRAGEQIRVFDTCGTMAKERNAKKNATRSQSKKSDIAVIDFETDPFDGVAREKIYPFVAEIYSDKFAPIIIWEENFESFVDAVYLAIYNLPRAFTLYAHNGGRFDYLFLIHKLRGKISFKGRGIMRAMIGRHELRDSFHIIPERLANFQKEKFDYQKLTRKNRHSFKDEILSYLHSDCVYLLDIVKAFVERYGKKLSIGQAALAAVKNEYPDIQFIHEKTDEKLRRYFFGGRVECLQGAGEFNGDYKLYDVNSMYPFVMAKMRHPIGCDYQTWNAEPDDNTAFLTIECFSKGAFPVRVKNEGLLFPHEYGVYDITIHEYNAAKKLCLISDVKIKSVVQCNRFTTFEKFVLPLYEKRQNVKEKLRQMRDSGLDKTPEYVDAKKDDIFFKLLLNNAYGKFAQNPRRFAEWFFTDPGDAPDGGEWEKSEDLDLYSIWKRPQSEWRFNNVGTAASITGAARSVLMSALASSKDAVYCDTDSIICRDLTGVDLHPSILGAWDLEREMKTVRIAGKKLYGYADADFQSPIAKCKGGALTFDQLTLLINGAAVYSEARAPTLTRDGAQSYVDRTIRATVARRKE
jgi:hypothetical protein